MNSLLIQLTHTCLRAILGASLSLFTSSLILEYIFKRYCEIVFKMFLRQSREYDFSSRQEVLLDEVKQILYLLYLNVSWFKHVRGAGVIIYHCD